MSVFELGLTAVAAVFGLSLLASLFAPYARSAKEEGGILSGYLLANGGLSKLSLVNLLLSTSFGLNTFFYQGWLGYTVGVWGIVIQAAWAVSFLWLARYVAGIRASKSLHDFLATRFGPLARVLGALCSILGLLFLMGWEVDICRQMFAGFMAGGATPSPSHMNSAGWLAAAAAIGALVYTLYGGLRGNAMADILQNVIKVFVLCLLIWLLFNLGTSTPPQAFVWDKMLMNLGIIGLITNMIFSVCWQFVDASTWQNVEASSERQTIEETVRSLRWSGLAAFVIPGILGTAVGIALSGQEGITESTFFYSIVGGSGGGAIIIFLFFFATVAAVMSLVDGLLLASAYALVVDLARPRSTLVELDRDELTSAKIVASLRICLIVMAFGAAWGVRAMAEALGYTTFELVYIVIIPQLALFGPVIFGLTWRNQAATPSRSRGASIAIMGSLVAGLWCTIYGGNYADWLPAFSGTITVILSCLLTYTLVKDSATETVA